MAYWGNEPAKSAVKIGDDVILSSHIDDGVIVNADINASAAIATSKISGALTSVAGSHGLGSLAALSTIASAQITDGTIVNADINASAAIAYSKLGTIPTFNQSTTGSAATLTTARNIGGVSFNGSAAINLPGVNSAGNQTTTGQAGTVATIAGLAPNTATTQATQGAITSAANLATVGTIGTGVWDASVIASAKLDADTAHLSEAQTFSGAKTFQANMIIEGADFAINRDSSKLSFNEGDGTNKANMGFSLNTGDIMDLDLVPDKTFRIRQNTGSSARVALELAHTTGNATFAGAINANGGFSRRLDQNTGTNMEMRNNHTGTSHYAEMYIGDSVNQLTMGYSNNYSSDEWAGGWVYAGSGKLHIKSSNNNIQFFTGGTGNGDRALILDTSQNATFYGSISVPGTATLNASSNNVGDALTIYSTSYHQYPKIHSNGAYEAMWNYENNVSQWYVGLRTSSQLLGTTGFHFYNTTAGETVGGFDVSGNLYAIGKAWFNGGSQSSTLGIKAHTNGWDGGMTFTSNDGSMVAKLHPENGSVYGMMLDSKLYVAGNVGLGVAPDATYDLKVNGTSYFGGNITSIGTVTGTSFYVGVSNQIRMPQADGNRYGAIQVDQTAGGGGGTQHSLRIISKNDYGAQYGQRITMETAGSERFVVEYNGVCSGDLNDTSDVSLKKTIQPIESSLNIIKELNPVSFYWKKGENRGEDKQKGFIAQEVESIIPEVVHGEDGNKSINVTGIVAQLTKAVQELSAKVEALENA